MTLNFDYFDEDQSDGQRRTYRCDKCGHEVVTIGAPLAATRTCYRRYGEHQCGGALEKIGERRAR